MFSTFAEKKPAQQSGLQSNPIQSHRIWNLEALPSLFSVIRISAYTLDLLLFKIPVFSGGSSYAIIDGEGLKELQAPD
jgi:hypothetical protein